MPSPNHETMQRLMLGFAACAAAVVLGACGAGSSNVSHTVTDTVTQTVTAGAQTPTTTVTDTSTSTSPTAPTTTSSTAGTSSSPASTNSSTTTTPTTTTTTTGAAGQPTPACTAADLEPAFLGSNGATGRVVLAFALRNHGSNACHTYGWPGVAFAGSDGSALPTKTNRTTEDLLGSTPPARLTLGPGQQASFRIIVPDSNNGTNVGCSTASQVRIIPPDDTATVIATLTAPITECGTATLSPLLSGGDAQPGV